MKSDLVQLKVRSDAVIDIDIQNEIMRLKDRMKSLETLWSARLNIIEMSSNELLKTILQKLELNAFVSLILYTCPYIERV